MAAVPAKLYINDFRFLEELGEGNFTRIFLAEYKKTGEVFAIKSVEKATVDKVRKRHKNVNNEILMEKRALTKLKHENIVKLFSTFQDASTLTLYYQMEYFEGGEVWKLLRDPLDKDGHHVGCFWDMARYFIAATINAVEYMHRKGIVHRDLKPENMMLDAHGVLKLIDFGTAKDLIQTDLNGPEFVGTPDYMSPSTVKGKTPPSEGEAASADLWSIGVILYQLLFGVPAFNAPSPYLTFLRIQRANLRIPDFAPDCVKDLLSMLLQKDNVRRMQSAMGVVPDHSEDSKLEYSGLRRHPFFTATKGLYQQPETSGDEAEPKFGEVVKVPSLLELCIRAVGRACEPVTACVAEYGSFKAIPESDPSLSWVRNFDLGKLPKHLKARIAFYLNRRQRLHPPSTLRLFYPSAIDAKICGRVEGGSREVIGFYRDMNLSSNIPKSSRRKLGYDEGEPDYSFHFAVIANPSITTASGGDDALKKAVSGINRLRPKFILVSGNFVNSPQGFPTHEEEMALFRKTIGRVSETIPILLVPGENDCCEVLNTNSKEEFARHPTPRSLSAYQRSYGMDYYGMWYGAIRVLIINSSLLINSLSAPEEYLAQNRWLAEELELAVLCSDKVFVFTYHPWFREHIHEDDSVGVVPRKERLFWLNKMRHKKVEVIFTSVGFDNAPMLVAHGVKAFSRDASRPDAASMEGMVDMGEADDSEVKEGEVKEGEEGNDDLEERSFSSSDDEDFNNGQGPSEAPHKATPDVSYIGPLLVSSPPLGSPFEGYSQYGIRIAHVQIYEPTRLTSYELKDIPSSLPGVAAAGETK